MLVFRRRDFPFTVFFLIPCLIREIQNYVFPLARARLFWIILKNKKIKKKIDQLTMLYIIIIII